MYLDSEPPQRSPTMVRYLVLAWLCLLATLAYIHRSCLSVPAGLIQDDLHLTKDDLAQIMSAFFLGYTLFQLPSGWLGDRWGARRALTLFIILWSAATGWMGLASGFMGMWVGWFVNGIAQAGIFPCCVKSISRWFPETQKAFPNGMLAGFMSVGAVMASALTGFLLKYLGWQEVFLWLALPGLIIAIIFYWWFRDKPIEHSWVNAEEVALILRDQPGIKKIDQAGPYPVFEILLSLPMILVCAQQFCRAAGYNLYMTWFPRLMQITRGATVEESGYWTSMALLGVVVGSPLGGLTSDWIFRVTGSKQLARQGLAMTSLSICAVLILTAYYMEDALPTVLLLTASSFFAGLAGPAAYTITIDLGGRHVATVFSTMNMMGNLGAFLMPLVVAELVDWYSWNEALLLLSGLYFAAAACWMFVRVETKKPQAA